MSAPTATRGRPLVVLASILGAWLVGRVLFWNPLFPHMTVSPVETPPAVGSTLATFAADIAETIDGGQVEERAAPADGAAFSFDLGGSPSVASAAALEARFLPNHSLWAGRPEYSSARRAAGHQMLLAAAFAHRPVSGRAAEPWPGAPEPASRSATSRARLSVDRPLLGASNAPDEALPPRLSGDSWLLWRNGSDVAETPGGSTYGRSQAGAVMRYRLLPGHVHVPEAYARATRTLEGSRQSEVAAGLSFRPLARVPLTVAAEARVTETAGGQEVRPAAFAVTQLPPVPLPLGLRGEAYVQGGYVGGRFETAFIDGQARIDGRMVQLRSEDELRLGLAAWGGAQKGAARFDIGPSAALTFKMGGARARIAVDYRLRVAGEAAPASGPAVTFSAGF